MTFPLAAIDQHHCLSTPVLRALEAGSDRIETRPRGKYSQLTKDIRELTRDEAGALVDSHDRGHFKFSPEDFDDLLMWASTPWIFDHESSKRQEKIQKCEGCKKEFPALRASAKYCSRSCEGRAHRRRRVANSSTHTPGTTRRRRRT